MTAARLLATFCAVVLCVYVVARLMGAHWA